MLAYWAHRGPDYGGSGVDADFREPPQGEVRTSHFWDDRRFMAASSMLVLFPWAAIAWVSVALEDVEPS